MQMYENLNSDKKLRKFTKNKSQVLKIDSLKNLTVSMIEKNKIRFLIITQRKPIGPEFLVTVNQFSSMYPFVKTIALIIDYTLDTIISLTEAGIDKVIDYNESPDFVTDKIAAILNEPTKQLMPSIQIGDLVFNPTRRRITRSGNEIHLRKKEFELLEFMLQNPNRVYNRDELLTVVWGYNNSSFSNTVDVHMASLRRKIDKGQKQKLIHTVHGQGYKIGQTKK